MWQATREEIRKLENFKREQERQTMREVDLLIAMSQNQRMCKYQSGNNFIKLIFSKSTV
jgi:hypothetical protein